VAEPGDDPQPDGLLVLHTAQRAQRALDRRQPLVYQEALDGELRGRDVGGRVELGQLSTTDEPVKKIATAITVSDELLEDAAAAQGFVGGRLSLFVRIEEERQLLRGAGTNELVGIVGRSGVNTYSKPADDDNVTAIAKVISNTAGSSHVQPTGIVMHPQNWLAARLLRDGTGGTTGAYFGAGPFGVAAQNAGAANLFGQVMWDTPVALSTTVGLGTAIVGGFSTAAAIARRGGPTVEASNSHDDYFVKDLVSIRAEQRQALLVYRPAAFTVVSGLTS
jgi:HK97 family phage major capsid protein